MGKKAFAVAAVAVVAAIVAKRLLDQPAAVGEAPAAEPSPESRQPTRQELYEQAQRLDIPGRSRMNKAELRAAIRARTAP